jgi:hypothetical protein
VAIGHLLEVPRDDAKKFSACPHSSPARMTTWPIVLT